jgi:probable addiction module antidote protein
MATSEYKTSDYLKTQNDIAEYLNLSLEENDPKQFLIALRNVIEAQEGGFTKISEKSKLNRVSMYRMLSENGNPRLDSILRLFNSLGIRLKCEN